MTDSEQTPKKSINDSLPSSNPSLRSVLLVIGGLIAAVALILVLVEMNK